MVGGGGGKDTSALELTSISFQVDSERQLVMSVNGSGY